MIRVAIRRSPLIALLVTAAVTTAVAEERDMKTIVDELRREPMSLFDWGMFLIEEELQSVLRNRKDFLRVFWEPRRNRITIDAVFLVDPNEVDHIGAQRTCYTRLHAIKLTLGVIDTFRINFAPAADFRFGMKFSHRDSDAFPEEQDAAALGREMMEAVYLKVGVATDGDHFPFNQAMHCEGALLSQDVDYRISTNEDLGPK